MYLFIILLIIALLFSTIGFASLYFMKSKDAEEIQGKFEAANEVLRELVNEMKADEKQNNK